MSSSGYQVSIHYRDTSFVDKNAGYPIMDSPDCTSSPTIEKPIEVINVSTLSAFVKPTHPMVTRSKLGAMKPNPRLDLVGTVHNALEPTSVKEALAHSRCL